MGVNEPVARTDIVSTVLCAIFCEWLCPMMNHVFHNPGIMSEIAGWYHYHICEPILLWHLGYTTSPFKK